VVLRRRCVVLCTVCQFVLLHMVFSTRCYGCGPKEPVLVLCTVCKFVSGHKLTHSAQDYTLAPQDHSHDTQC